MIDRAKEKLEKELKNASGKEYAEPIINWLLSRIQKSQSLAEDILQEHKTWKKCFDYIYSQARKQSKGSCVCVRDELVYEWAEDYYRKDDKAEEEEKAKKEVKIKAKEAEKKAKEAKKAEKSDANKARPDYDTTLKASTDNHKLSKEKIKNLNKRRLNNSNNAIEGQMDIFSFVTE